jgi:hypothetical protein
MGANTLEKSCAREKSYSTIFGIFGHLSWFLDEMICHEKGQLLARLCPEVAQERLETGGWRTEGTTTEGTKNTEQ